MSSIKLYKKKINIKGGWQIEEPVENKIDRKLWRVTIGEAKYGDNVKPLQIEIYEDILDELVSENKNIILDIQSGRDQVNMMYSGHLLEYNPQKTVQYNRLRKVLGKYSVRKKIRLYNGIFLNMDYNYALPDEVKEFQGTTNANLRETYTLFVIRYLLWEEIEKDKIKRFSISQKVQEFSQYIENISAEELAELASEALYIAFNCEPYRKYCDVLSEEFDLTRKEIKKAAEQEIINRFFIGRK